MIVICTKCQAKFRVADDKIGPRGAKVRCSKCQTVFLVHPVFGTLPVTDGEARHPKMGPGTEPPASAAPPPLPAAAAPPPSDPFAAPPPPSDPFAAPQPDPFAAPPSPDPFAAADPFAAPPAASPGPTGPTGLGDPFVAAVAPRSTLPVTDLSDLLGTPAAAAAVPAPAPQVPPPLPAAAGGGVEPDPFAVSAPAPAAAPEPSFDFAAPDLAGASAPAVEEPSLDLGGGSPAVDVGGLSLEDRLTPPPTPLAPPAAAEGALDVTLEAAVPSLPASGGPVDPFAGFAAAPAGSAEPFDPGAFDFGGHGDLAAPEPGAEAPAPAAAPPSPPPPRVAAAAPAPAPAPAVASMAATPVSAAVAAASSAAAERIPGGGASRLRTVAVNAVALFALLVVALGLWAVWRTEGPIDAASLRPSAILAALGRGATGPWAAQDVRSGVFDRARGAPLLFVRGRVVSRAPAPVSGVKVAVQVVRGGDVLARGEALAGAVPSEEELYLAVDDAAVAAAAAAARARAPAQVQPGDSVPFLVAIGDAPPELQGASLRIEIAPAGGGAR